MLSAHQVLPQFVWVRDLRHHRSEAGEIIVARPSPRVRCATHLANGGTHNRVRSTHQQHIIPGVSEDVRALITNGQAACANSL